jgi:hypothetical protein
LGHKVSGEGILPDPQKSAAISQHPPPTNVKELMKFLGLFSYYRKFIREFSTVAQPLVSLLKKGMKFVWHGPQKLSFKHLVDALSSPSTLVHFEETAELFLKTDASYAGLGAVLIQKKDREEKVVSFLSRRLLTIEANWSSNDLECFAVVWAIKKLRPHLYGREFYSDNVTAVSLLRKKDLTGKFARWVMDLAEYDFKILHYT